MAGNLTAMIAAIYGISAAIPDPYFEYTTLLLPGNGTNGAQNNTFLDGSTNNFTITRNGNTTQGTFSPFSQTGWGNYFDGSGDELAFGTNASFQFGSTTNATIDVWIYPTDIATARNIAGYYYYINGVPEQGWQLNMNAGGAIRFRNVNTGASTSTSAVVANTWTRVTVTITNGTVQLYLNGATSGGTVSFGTGSYSSVSMTVGALNSNGHGTGAWIGYLSNLRVVVGSVVIPPAGVGTEPLTAISGTALLTCQSNRFLDTSTNAVNPTIYGSPSVVSFSPFNPTASWSAATNGGSGYFDGSGDWINPNTTSANLALGAGDFTIEFWLYTPRGATRQCLFDFRNDGSTASINPATAPIIIWGDNGAGTNGNWLRYTGISNGTSIANADLLGVTLSTLSNQWNHIAIVRSSGTVYGYLNGVRKNSVADATNYNVNCSVSIAAALNGGVNYLGNISDFRVVKGTAVYTGTTYTVPTAPLTAITNTSLLLNFTNAGIYDATSKNDLETVGNAQISTAISAKWGSGSMYFGGTGDYLAIPSSQFNLFAFNTGDFTLEAWIYPTALSGDDVIISSYYFWATSVNFYFGTRSGSPNVLLFRAGDSVPISILGNTAVNLNEWCHVAVTRSSGVTRMFVNGVTQTATHTGSVNISGTIAPIFVGANNNAAEFWTGYMQDVRVTKGYARYTANFTPPTSAFPTL